MNFIKDNLSEIQKIFTQSELQINKLDSDRLIIAGASSSKPERITGLSIAILSLILPFSSDLFDDSGNTNMFGSYDFYNHQESIPLRLMTFLPGLCVFLFYRKNTRCVLDKNTNTFLVIQKHDWKTLRSEGGLEEISGVEISQVENSSWSIFESSTFTNMLVRLLKRSGESVSFTFIVKINHLDETVLKTRNILCQFLDLPI
jgi:hypothetical protein